MATKSTKTKKKVSKTSTSLVISKPIQDLIIDIRGHKVMVDADLAELYGVPTKALNQAVKRNSERFPADFMFKLSKTEKKELVTNCDRFKNLKHSSSSPSVFTEYGVLMLASILSSDIAVNTSIEIVRAFSKMRAMLATSQDLAKKINSIEKKVTQHDENFKAVFEAIRKLILPENTKKKPVGFHLNMKK